MTMPSESMQSETMRPVAASLTGNGSTVGDAHLRELADVALRRAARVAQLEEKADLVVHELIGRTCSLARERGVRVEQVVLLLKEAWRELPEARRLPRHDASDMLARTITVCIRSYYTRGD